MREIRIGTFICWEVWSYVTGSSISLIEALLSLCFGSGCWLGPLISFFSPAFVKCGRLSASFARALSKLLVLLFSRVLCWYRGGSSIGVRSADEPQIFCFSTFTVLILCFTAIHLHFPTLKRHLVCFYFPLLSSCQEKTPSSMIIPLPF